MSGRPALLFAPAGLAGLGAALALGGDGPLGAAAWVGAGAAFALSLRSAPRDSVWPVEELQRHVARCRRRGARAAVLVARVGAPPHRSTPKELAASFRLTDSVMLTRAGRGYELVAVFDDDELDREAVERRLRAAAGAAPTTVAWRRFPDDGVTLGALVEAARAAMPSTPGADALVVSPVLETAHAATPAEGK